MFSYIALHPSSSLSSSLLLFLIEARGSAGVGGILARLGAHRGLRTAVCVWGLLAACTRDEAPSSIEGSIEDAASFRSTLGSTSNSSNSARYAILNDFGQGSTLGRFGRWRSGNGVLVAFYHSRALST